MKIRFSYIWALIAIATVGLWMGTGTIIYSGDPDSNAQTNNSDSNGAPASEAASSQDDDNRPLVRVDRFETEPRKSYLTMRGRTEAEAHVQIMAEMSARIIDVAVQQGQNVSQGDLLCRLDEGALEAELLEAQARLEQASLDFEAATRLQKQGFSSEIRLKSTKAFLDSASAQLAAITKAIDKTHIKAPFDGVIDLPLADIGAMLMAGQSCASLVKSNPMIIVGQVSERQIEQLKTGMNATIHLVTGQNVVGKIRFLSSVADSETRTFRIEIAVPNDDYALKSGVTATAKIDLPPQNATKIKPSMLVLDDDGIIGVRAVDDDKNVAFHPVQIISDGADGLWVQGLPSPISIITVGQDYVKAGEAVRIHDVSADDKANSSDNRASMNRNINSDM